MYRRILVPLEHSPADEAILRHVRPLAKLSGATLLLLHVADGWVARNIRQLDLRESEEMREDRTYLEQVCATLRAEGFDGFFFSSRRRHTKFDCDWSSDVCSSDLPADTA